MTRISESKASKETFSTKFLVPSPPTFPLPLNVWTEYELGYPRIIESDIQWHRLQSCQTISSLDSKILWNLKFLYGLRLRLARQSQYFFSKWNTKFDLTNVNVNPSVVSTLAKRYEGMWRELIKIVPRSYQVNFPLKTGQREFYSPVIQVT